MSENVDPTETPQGGALELGKTAADADPLPSLDVATAALAPFFESNPESTIDQLTEGEPYLRISKPWGDESLVFIIKDGFADLAAALNQVILPPRFSAIWHRDLRKLEVIWTTYRMTGRWKEILDRKFEFLHRELDHPCEFGASSDKLLTLARHFSAETISETLYRNISSFASFVKAQAKAETHQHLDQPRSFWIGNVDWDEDKVVDLVDHLNFYMMYFDTESPIVLIHDPKIVDITKDRERYIRGKFPVKIEGKPLDENLLSFWAFAADGNPMLRFLLYYRILEYAAVHFIDHGIRDELKKVILSPDLRSDLSGAIEAMVGAMSATKLTDSQKLQGLMRKSVDTSLLWRDLRANWAFFSKDVTFDGGFFLKACVQPNDSEATFKARGGGDVADAFRKIRNALSHGKDQETAGVIRPTARNFSLFDRWVHLITTAAGEVVLYKDVT